MHKPTLFAMILALSGAPAARASTTTCLRLLATTVDQAVLHDAARTPAVRERLPELYADAQARRARIAARAVTLQGLDKAQEGFDENASVIGTVIDFLAPGFALTKRARGTILVDQQRRKVERPQTFDVWALEDLDREMERLVFDDLERRSAYFKTLRTTRHAYQVLASVATSLNEKIVQTRDLVTRAREGEGVDIEMAAMYPGQKEVGLALTELNDLIAKVMDLAGRLGVAPADTRLKLEPTGYDVQLARLAKVGELAARVETIAKDVDGALSARVREIIDDVGRYSAELAEKSSSAPSADE